MRLRDFPEDEVFLQGSAACQGCPGSAALRVAFKALGRNTILAVIASCTSVFQSPFPLSALDIPTINMAFATGGAVASGITAAADRLVARGDFEEKPTVVAWAGDGGTFVPVPKRIKDGAAGKAVRIGSGEPGGCAAVSDACYSQSDFCGWGQG